MCHFGLTEVKPSVPQSQIVKIVFIGCVNVTFPLDVITDRFLNEEGILKVLKEAADAGTPITNLKCIYPEDGVVLIPSTVMTVAEDHSKNVNIEACEAVEQWLLSEEAQKLILQGYMHSVFKGMTEIPYESVDTNWLIEKDLGVDWENAYKNREAINTAWTETVTTK